MTESGTIKTDDGISLSWRADGDPSLPPLLLANSLGTAMAMWEQQLALWTSVRRVIRFDTCGHGMSAARATGFGIDRLGLDALAILDHLGIERADFVGLSLGGMVGQWLGITAPHRLNRLVLANTSAHMPPPETWNARIATVLSDGLPAISSAVLGRWFTPAFLAHSPVPAAFETALVSSSPQGYAAACASIRDMDFRDQLKTIKRPTLVIGGLHDPATPPAHSELLAREIASAQIVWLNAAHLSNVEDPINFGEAVSNFLTQNS
jgi:3-oxoadipate enol-lactonase